METRVALVNPDPDLTGEFVAVRRNLAEGAVQLFGVRRVGKWALVGHTASGLWGHSALVFTWNVGRDWDTPALLGRSLLASVGIVSPIFHPQEIASIIAARSRPDPTVLCVRGFEALARESAASREWIRTFIEAASRIFGGAKVPLRLAVLWDVSMAAVPQYGIGDPYSLMRTPPVELGPVALEDCSRWAVNSPELADRLPLLWQWTLGHRPLFRLLVHGLRANPSMSMDELLSARGPTAPWFERFVRALRSLEHGRDVVLDIISGGSSSQPRDGAEASASSRSRTTLDLGYQEAQLFIETWLGTAQSSRLIRDALRAMVV